MGVVVAKTDTGRTVEGYAALVEAAKASIHFAYLSKIENNRMDPPSEEVLRAIASALDVDHYELSRRAGCLT